MDSSKPAIILRDKQLGRRDRPWKPQKVKSLALAASYIRIGKNQELPSFEKAGSRVWVCGDTLEFKQGFNTVTGEDFKKLSGGNFCRDRLCPMCSWRKSIVSFSQLSRVMDWVEANYFDLTPIFLTLTVRNCEVSELSKTIDLIQKAWKFMMKDRQIKKRVKGTFRSLEVTYNSESKTFHPHLHAVVMVPNAYFHKHKNLYMTNEDWQSQWQRFLDADYSPVVDVRKIGNGEGRSKAVAEVAKYAVKPGDWLSDDFEQTDFVVFNLRDQLHGRKLVTFSGVLLEAKKALKLEDVEKADLIHVGEDETIRGDVVELIEVYKWNVGMTNYLLELSYVPSEE